MHSGLESLEESREWIGFPLVGALEPCGLVVRDGFSFTPGFKSPNHQSKPIIGGLPVWNLEIDPLAKHGTYQTLGILSFRSVLNPPWLGRSLERN